MSPADRIPKPHARLRALLAAFVAVIALGAAPGRATADEALDAYKKGASLFDGAQYLEAAAAFRQAYDLKPSWKLLYNIGQCEAAAKRYGHALVAFESYLVEGGDEIQNARRVEVMQEIERLRPLVGMMEIKAPDGARVTVDDEIVGTAPLTGPLRVSAKEHHVVISLNGEAVLDQRVSVPGQSTITVNASEEPPRPAATEAAGEAAGSEPIAPAQLGQGDGRKMSPLVIASIVTGAVGLVGAGLGGYFVYKGSTDFDAYKKAAANGDADKYADYKNDVIPADKIAVGVSFGVGGALIATAATLLIVDAFGEKSDAAVAVAPAPGGLSVEF
jgi:tetratricopeptide (TPR) repeat protein